MLAHLLEKVSQELGMSKSSASMEEPVDSDGEEDDDESQSKRPKLNDEDKVQKCRERNRIHARNTRERKRAQMDLLQQRIQELSDEKKQLEEYEPEVSVASILMSLSSCSQADGCSSEGHAHASHGADTQGSRTFAADAIERIRTQISATLSDDEELELSSEFHTKDKSQCSTQELETIRRERNRMHAKKTRLRKKKMLTEMEAIITSLEHDVRELKRKHSLLLLSEERAGSSDASRTGAGANTGGSASANSSNSSAAAKAARQSKFTGFRHLHNKTMGGVTMIDGLRQGPATFLKDKESGKEGEFGLERPPQSSKPQTTLTPSPRVPPLPAFMTFAATMSGPSVQQQQLAQQASRDNRELAPLVYFPTKAPEVKSEPSSARVKVSDHASGSGKRIEGGVSERKLEREYSRGSSSGGSENGSGDGGSGGGKGTSNGGTTTNSSSASDSSSPRSNSDA